MKPEKDSRSKIDSSLLRNRAGQGLVEYSLLLLLVAIVIVATLRALGTTVSSHMYDPINSAVTSAGQ